jgi:hypothetical protein
MRPAFWLSHGTLFSSDPVTVVLSLHAAVIFSPGQTASLLLTLRGLLQQSCNKAFISGLLLSQRLSTALTCLQMILRNVITAGSVNNIGRHF